jgi:hypothetical protein
MTNIERFINSIESSNSKKVAQYALKNINDNIENYNLMELEQLILDRKPNSPKEIVTVCYILGSYSKWLQEQNIVNNDNLYQLVSSLDKKLLWKKSKSNAKKKFISEKDYQRVIKDIATYEEYNSLYYELLFSCIWNGVYSDDLSVIKNMRKSDIDDNGMITLRKDNNHTYKIKIPEKLAMDLKKLADITMWQRPNRYGICNVEMRGMYNDSIFKVEHRNTSSNGSYRFTYYSKLRKIAKEYLEHSLLPLQLYASGIMHRIKVELEKNNITLKEAFSDNNRNRLAYSIISKELIRCNSGIETSNFRELVKGHLEAFE